MVSKPLSFYFPSLRESPELLIKGIRIYPTQVTPGDLFICLPFLNPDEDAAIKEAIARGAAALITNKKNYQFFYDIPIFEVESVSKAFSEISSNFYSQQPNTIVGVTGTCGKSSVVSFVRQLWDLLGNKSASLGTLGLESLHINSDKYPPVTRTTPYPLILHCIFSELVKSQISHIAIEVSSQGLDNHRVDNVNFAAAAFTNLGNDHLNYHKTQEAYFKAKLLLFEQVLESGKLAVLNRECPFSKEIEKVCFNRKHHIIWVGYNNSDISINKIFPHPGKTEIFFTAFGKNYETIFNVPGIFQVENLLTSVALVVGLGADINDCLKAIKLIEPVRGRMDLVGTLQNNAQIYVDYAHTPEALRNALASLSNQVTGEITLIFGCGGGTDNIKRAEMARIAQNYANKVIITDDNPRNEDPQIIRKHLLKYCPKAIEIPLRNEAIKEAIRSLPANAACLIAGKGHETKQIYADATLQFDDKEEAKKYLRF